MLPRFEVFRLDDRLSFPGLVDFVHRLVQRQQTLLQAFLVDLVKELCVAESFPLSIVRAWWARYVKTFLVIFIMHSLVLISDRSQGSDGKDNSPSLVMTIHQQVFSGASACVRMRKNLEGNGRQMRSLCRLYTNCQSRP